MHSLIHYSNIYIAIVNYIVYYNNSLFIYSKNGKKKKIEK